MATTHIRETGSSSAPWLAFAIGLVLLAAIVAAFFYFQSGRLDTPTRPVDVEINAPKMPDVNLPDAPRLPKG